MARRLFTVEEVFTIHWRGTILVPGIVPEGDERFHIGDTLRLRRPDESELLVTIDGIDLFNVSEAGAYSIVVALPKSEVPLGTEVWSTEAHLDLGPRKRGGNSTEFFSAIPDDVRALVYEEEVFSQLDTAGVRWHLAVDF
jgi:hypothetical protein